MLDDYVKEQPIVYRVMKNSINKNQFSHAYLFELNGYSKGLDIALAFAKFLLCPNNYSNLSNCGNCVQCHNIDTSNFLEIKIIRPDGQWIKKEQLDELQRQFMTKSLSGNKKIYIITEADKLNISAANSLLKFLEEPPEGIIAILLTDNMYQLLETIISRCQILSFKKNINSNQEKNSLQAIGKYLYNEKSLYESFIADVGLSYIDEVIEYILFLEKKKEETIIYKNKDFLEVFNDRQKLMVAFDLFVLYYKDVLNKLLNIESSYFCDYEQSLVEVANKNNLKQISEKIKIIMKLKVNIKYNLNANLLMDKLVILLSEV